MDIRIEPIRIEHVEGFHAALDSVAREACYLAMTEAPPLERLRERVIASIAHEAPNVVALADGKVVGWCEAMLNQKAALSHHACIVMGIMDGYREQGIGTRLLSAVIEAARTKGLHHLYLEVYKKNTRARALYKKFGFIETGVQPKFFHMPDGTYEDAIMMWLPLNP